MTHRARTLELQLPTLKELATQVIADDEAEAFPSEVSALIRESRIMEEMIPASSGGEMLSIQSVLDVNRVLSRRNLTAAIAIGQTLLGSLPVWIAGSPEQKSRLVDILRGGGLNCIALTEQAHGSDLQGNQVSITADGESGYLLSGEKWCINNATLGAAMSVLARSHPAGGEQGFSLLFLDKSALQPDSFQPLPKLKTHGLRGADISGIRFSDTPVSGNALVGREGAGLTITFKTLQISRTLCAGFSLGAGDTSLRLAMDFVHGRQLYGMQVDTLSAVQSRIANSYHKILLAEATAWIVARFCTLLPAQLSVYSSLVKYLVPTLMDEVIAESGILLGARGYLREGDYALFQKMRRDHAVVPLFDGSTEVNLFVIVGQLRALFRDRPHTDTGHDDLSMYCLDTPAPAFEGSGLKLSNRGQDFIWESLHRLVTCLPEEIASLAQGLIQQYHALRNDHRDAAKSEHPVNSTLFILAQRYCELTAKALYLQFWWHNRGTFAEALMEEPAWVKMMISGSNGDASSDAREQLFHVARQQWRAHQLFSHLAFSLRH